MDLTIHYHLSLPGDVIKVRRAIEKLHETACGCIPVRGSHCGIEGKGDPYRDRIRRDPLVLKARGGEIIKRLGREALYNGNVRSNPKSASVNQPN